MTQETFNKASIINKEIGNLNLLLSVTENNYSENKLKSSSNCRINIFGVVISEPNDEIESLCDKIYNSYVKNITLRLLELNKELEKL